MRRAPASAIAAKDRRSPRRAGGACRRALRRDNPGGERQARSGENCAIGATEGNGALADAGLREPIVGEAWGHPSADQHIGMTMKASAPRVEYSAKPIRASSMWNAILARASAATSATTFALRPFRPAITSPRRPREHHEECDVDCSGGEAANRRGDIDGDPTRRAKRDEPRKRRSGDWKAAGPVGDRGQVSWKPRRGVAFACGCRADGLLETILTRAPCSSPQSSMAAGHGAGDRDSGRREQHEMRTP